MAMVSSTVGFDKHRLEAALQSGVLLDVFLVFVEGGGANRAQFTARQSRLQHIGSVHGAFGGTGANEGVQLVDEQDDLPFGFGNFL